MSSNVLLFCPVLLSFINLCKLEDIVLFFQTQLQNGLSLNMSVSHQSLLVVCHQKFTVIFHTNYYIIIIVAFFPTTTVFFCFILFYFYFLKVLGMEPRGLCVLSKHSTTCSPFIFFFETMLAKLTRLVLNWLLVYVSLEFVILCPQPPLFIQYLFLLMCMTVWLCAHE